MFYRTSVLIAYSFLTTNILLALTPEEELRALLLLANEENEIITQKVEAFLKEHPTLNIKNHPFGTTYMHYAILRLHAPLIELLIHHKFEVDEKNRDSITPFVYLLRLWNKDCREIPNIIAPLVSLLALQDVQLPATEDTEAQEGLMLFFHYLAKTGNMQVITRLVERKAPIAPLAVLIAFNCKHRDLARWLVEHGAPLDMQNGAGITVLALAATNEDNEFVTLLLAHGADPNKASRRKPLILVLADNCQPLQPLDLQQFAILYTLLTHGMHIPPATEETKNSLKHLLATFTDLERDALDDTLVYLSDSEYKAYIATRGMLKYLQHQKKSSEAHLSLQLGNSMQQAHDALLSYKNYSHSGITTRNLQKYHLYNHRLVTLSFNK